MMSTYSAAVKSEWFSSSSRTPASAATSSDDPEHRDDVVRLRGDQVGAPREVGPVEARRDAEDRAADQRGAVDPARDPFATVVLQEVAGGQQPQALPLGAPGEVRERAVVERARVVQVELHERRPRLPGLGDHPVEPDLARLEPRVPAQRVGAEHELRHKVSLPSTE